MYHHDDYYEDENIFDFGNEDGNSSGESITPDSPKRSKSGSMNSKRTPSYFINKTVSGHRKPRAPDLYVPEDFRSGALRVRRKSIARAKSKSKSKSIGTTGEKSTENKTKPRRRKSKTGKRGRKTSTKPKSGTKIKKRRKSTGKKKTNKKSKK